jgi:hypothetical protein
MHNRGRLRLTDIQIALLPISLSVETGAPGPQTAGLVAASAWSSPWVIAVSFERFGRFLTPVLYLHCERAELLGAYVLQGVWREGCAPDGCP